MQQLPQMPAGMELLYRNMTDRIQETEQSGVPSILGVTEKCIAIVQETLDELRDIVLNNPFADASEEIRFFKLIKPQFSFWLIYFLKIYRIEINRPPASHDIEEEYLMKELLKLSSYFDNNREFYYYYRSGSTHLDSIYFLRGKQELLLTLNAFWIDADPRFSTSHDYNMAKILAHEMLRDFLNNSLDQLSNKPGAKTFQGTTHKPLNWTAPKAALVEIIYSLQSYGAFNNGKADIKELATFLQEAFHVELGNYYNSFQEMRLRKKSRTTFLDQLTEKLVQRMNEADEN